MSAVGFAWRRETDEVIEQSRRVNDELLATAERLSRYVDQLRAELDRLEHPSNEEDPSDG